LQAISPDELARRSVSSPLGRAAHRRAVRVDDAEVEVAARDQLDGELDVAVGRQRHARALVVGVARARHREARGARREALELARPVVLGAPAHAGR
jgi:hypothetical protein